MQAALLKIYDRLLKTYGPQFWWPGETPFEVCIGAILTQNVSWSNVEKAISNLKAEELMSLRRIDEASNQEIAQLIRPAGYYNMKAKKLKAFCKHVKDKYKGSLNTFLNVDIRLLRRELLSIYGIGNETADSIILYAANKPIFVIDAYTDRIFRRVGLVLKNRKYEELQNYFMSNLLEDVNLYNEYHALIVQLGKSVCKKTKPKCSECPINDMCLFKTKEE